MQRIYETGTWRVTNQIIIIRPRRSRNATAYSRQTFPWTICRSLGLSVCPSVCPMHCGKTADRIQMPFGIIGRTGPGMRQVVGFGDRSTERGTFGGEFGPLHCNQWGLYSLRVGRRRDAALFPNYFGQTCYCYYYYYAREVCTVNIKANMFYFKIAGNF